jgi:hypothetical protein
MSDQKFTLIQSWCSPFLSPPTARNHEATADEPQNLCRQEIIKQCLLSPFFTRAESGTETPLYHSEKFVRIYESILCSSAGSEKQNREAKTKSQVLIHRPRNKRQYVNAAKLRTKIARTGPKI